jgi:large subunit ribosomal protein L25
VQWDTWGTHVLHVDFTRISAHEKVEVQVAIELRGEAPGVKEGGVIKQSIHDVQIECPASSVPERLSLSINDLKLNESITLGDLKLPEGATILGEGTTVVVECVEPLEVPEEEIAVAAPGEPEVIGAKEDEEE